MSKPTVEPLRLGLELVLRWAFMLIVLKAASKYWASEISWRGLAMAAATDASIRVAVHLIGIVALGVASLFFIDDAIASIGLELVLKRVSYNHSTA